MERKKISEMILLLVYGARLVHVCGRANASRAVVMANLEGVALISLDINDSKRDFVAARKFKAIPLRHRGASTCFPIIVSLYCILLPY